MAINLDDFGQLALERYTQAVDEHNALISKIKSVESRDKFEENFKESAPELAEVNAQIEKVRSALETLLGQRTIAAAPLVEPAYQAALSGVGVDPEVIKELKRKVAAGAKYLTTMYGESVLEGTPKPEAMRVAGSSSGSGEGSRRIRGFEVYVDGILAAKPNKDGKMVSNFTHAANMLKVEVVDLQRAFFQEAGSEDYKADNFPAVVTFEFGGKSVRVAKIDDSEDSE